MPILLSLSPTEDTMLSSVIGSNTRHVVGLPALRRAVQETPDEDLVVIGPDVDFDDAAAFAVAERVTRPDLGVVLVRRRVDSNVLRAALRAGLRDVVKADDLPAIKDACRSSQELSRRVRIEDGRDDTAPGRVSSGQVVTVFSAKGGCGKTFVATNMATSLARSGRRVCLVDLDLAFGDVGIALQLLASRTIADALGMTGGLDESAVQSLVTTHTSGLDTILAPVEPGTGDSIPASLVADLVTVLRRMYDVVVIDSPPALAEHVLATFDLTDHFVLLATLDIAALKNLKLTLETLAALGYPKDRWHVVLNRSDSQVGLTIADVEKSLATQIHCQIPSSRAVPSSVNRGIPLILDQPKHPVSQALTRFLAKLLPIPEPEAARKRAFIRLRRPSEAMA